MSWEQIKDAFNSLNSAAQQIGTTAAINEARDQARQIQSSVFDRQVRREQLTSVANDVAQRFLAMGAPATTIEQVKASIVPGLSPEEVKELELDYQTKLQSESHKLDLAKMRQQRIYNLELAKAKPGTQPKALTAGETEDLSLAKSAIAQLTDLDLQFGSLIKKGKTFTITNRLANLPFGTQALELTQRLWSDPEVSVFTQNAKQAFNEYRRYVTGAGASTKELDQLEQAFLDKKISPEAFHAQLKNLLKQAEGLYNRRLSSLENSERNIGKHQYYQRASPSQKLGAEPSKSDFLDPLKYQEK